MFRTPFAIRKSSDHAECKLEDGQFVKFAKPDVPATLAMDEMGSFNCCSGPIEAS